MARGTVTTRLNPILSGENNTMAVSIPQEPLVWPNLPVRADTWLMAPSVTEALVQNHGACPRIEVGDKDATIGHVLAGIQNNPRARGVSGNPVRLLVWQHDTTHLRRLLGARDVEHGEAVRLQDGLQPPMRELGIS